MIIHLKKKLQKKIEASDSLKINTEPSRTLNRMFRTLSSADRSPGNDRRLFFFSASSGAGFQLHWPEESNPHRIKTWQPAPGRAIASQSTTQFR